MLAQRWSNVGKPFILLNLDVGPMLAQCWPDVGQPTTQTLFTIKKMALAKLWPYVVQPTKCKQIWQRNFSCWPNVGPTL